MVLFHGWVRSSTLHLLKNRLYKQKIPEGSHPPGSFLYQLCPRMGQAVGSKALQLLRQGGEVAAGVIPRSGKRGQCQNQQKNQGIPHPVPFARRCCRCIRLSAGKPVIVHLKNTAVSGVKRHTNRTSSYEYHLTSSGWNEVNYPHIATSAAYGHWVCVVGIRADADPANLKESDFYALDPARVSANGTLAVTRLLDGTIWTDNSPLKTAG